LTSVVAEPADSRVEADRSTLDVEGSHGRRGARRILFDLGARVPVERVNLGLPELNTVVAVELLSREGPQDPWRHVAGRHFYRVNTADGELRNGPIDIATDTDRFWLARQVDGTGAAAGARSICRSPGRRAMSCSSPEVPARSC